MFELCLMHARADRTMREVVTKQLDPHGLTMMEWLVLGVVSQAPKNGFSMTQVAQILDVTLPQVTALVVVLVDHKLVKQTVLPEDRRGRQLTISSKGARLLDKIEGRVADAMRSWSRDIPRDQMYAYMLTVSQLSLPRD